MQRQQHNRKRLLLHVLALLLLSSLAALASMILVPAKAVTAHTFVIGSDPVDGSTVNTVPEVMRIFFNAPLSSISVAHVYALDGGKEVEVGAVHSYIAPADPRELITPLKEPESLPRGSYLVKWTAVSALDGHTSYGVIGFNVGFSSTGLSGTAILGPETSNNLEGRGGVRSFDFIAVLSVAWDWLVRVALVFWIGILVSERFVLSGSERLLELLARARKKASSLQWLCLSMLLVGELVIFFLRATRLTQAPGREFKLSILPQMLFETNYGYLWLIRLTLLGLALGLLYWSSRREQTIGGGEQNETSARLSAPSGGTVTSSVSNERGQIEGEVGTAETGRGSHSLFTPLWMTLIGLVVLSYTLMGEAIQTFQPAISAVIFDWLMRMAEGIWFGGLIYLGYVLFPLLLTADLERQSETVTVLLRRFTPFVLACVAILLVGGLFLGEASISKPDQLLNDSYGRTLLVQGIVFTALLGAGLYTFLVLRPKFVREVLLLHVVNADLPVRRVRQHLLGQRARGLKLGVMVQAGLSLVVLLCASLLSFFAPPIHFPDVTYEDTIASGGTVQSKQVGDLLMSLQVLPGKLTMANSIVVTLNTQDGKQVSDAEVQLNMNMIAMDMGTTRQTIKGGSPVYVFSLEQGRGFTMAGVWSIDVKVQRPGQSPLQTTFQVNIT